MKRINKNAVVTKIKNSMRKKFRIVRNDVACPEAFHPYWYRIEERYTLLFFFHWWGTPSFAPPHLFENESQREEVYAHEKRHIEDRIMKWASVDDIESAGLLAGFLGTKFYEFKKRII